MKIPIADIDILAAMKAAVVHDRGAKRDFIDVHGVSGLPGWSVGRFIEHGARMLPLEEAQIALALMARPPDSGWSRHPNPYPALPGPAYFSAYFTHHEMR